MRKREIWQKPKLRCDENKNLHCPVTWLELFFDLYFVVAVANVTHEFSAHLTWSGFGTLCLLFFPLIWLWIGITYYMERFETEGLENRLIIFVYMLSVGGMALFAHHGMNENYAGYIGSYLFGRIFTVYLWYRAGVHNEIFSPISKIYLKGFGLGLFLMFVSLFLPSPVKFWFLVLGIVIEMITPPLAVEPTAKLPKVSTSKYPERFGLFTILVLGETVFGFLSGLAKTNAIHFSEVFTGFLGALLAFSMWWIYFDFVARRSFKQGFPWIFIWVYLHVGIYLSVIIVGAGVLKATPFDGEVLPFAIRLAITGGIGLFLICVGSIEYVLHRDEDEPTHHHWSNWKKIIVGLVLLFLAYVDVNKYVYFLCFYPFVLVHIVYGIYVWFNQEVQEDGEDNEMTLEIENKGGSCV